MNFDIEDALFPPPPPDYFKITFFDKNNPASLTGGRVSVPVSRLSSSSVSAHPAVECSTNGGITWNPFYGPSMNGNITVTTGEVLFRGKGGGGFNATWSITANQGSAAKVSGNLNTLLDYKNPPDAIEQTAFRDMFFYQTDIVDAADLKLPATTLAKSCYAEMFAGCRSLQAAPELPAKTLADSCYAYMFSSCQSLQTAPELPAKTLENYCYRYMFHGCASLQIAPALPAKKLANYCYSFMFSKCVSLTTAPDLPADTLAASCYYAMFADCTSLNSVSVSFEDWNAASDSTKFWLKNVKDRGTFTCPANLDTISQQGDSYVPHNWTVNP
jgi:hypothetical protein